ncbi:MAG: hypothetical protein Q4E57_07650 [Eubacteriales bacterium]|nr:hypothetical protein [Eubacteriales bacterium]
MKNKLVAFSLISMLSALIFSTVSFAAWQIGDYGWRYSDADNKYFTNCWVWIDANNDSDYECYYFGPDGYMYKDRYVTNTDYVNADGMWTVNGIVQTRKIGGMSTPDYSNLKWITGTDQHNFYLKLNNLSGQDIAKAYLSAAGENNWGSDILKDCGVLESTASMDVSCSTGNDTRFFDLKCTTTSGDNIYFNYIDLSGLSGLSLNLLHSNGGYEAFTAR